jgi:tRNA nucleotidyltransferase (CCA-adding enzyme)
MGVGKILDSVLGRISLSRKETLDISSLAKRVAEKIKKTGKVDVFVGGSLAKGTIVRKEGKQDIDLFVVFSENKETFKLGKILKRIKLPGKLSTVHGSRDYFQIDCGEIILEIVPVVKNFDPSSAQNVTDVSLSHVKYIKKKILKDKKLAEEIKLAKVFCRANGVYGAEGYIKGFSGYALEILIIHFGSFIKMLKGLVRLKGKGQIVLDPEKHFRNSLEVLSELNSSKLKGPIILVDPTYNYRNACAGLSSEAFDSFILAAKKFLKSPSEQFFEMKKFDRKVLERLAKSRNAQFLELDLSTDRQEGDIAGTKMKKFFDFIIRQVEKKGQKVLGKAFIYSGEGRGAKGYLAIGLVDEIEVRGPPISNLEGVKKFKKARGAGKVSKRKGYLWTKEKVNIKNILKKANSIGKEMGASIGKESNASIV